MVASSSAVQPAQQLEGQGLVWSLQPPCTGQKAHSIPALGGRQGPSLAGQRGLLLGAASGLSQPHGAAQHESPMLAG